MIRSPYNYKTVIRRVTQFSLGQYFFLVLTYMVTDFGILKLSKELIVVTVKMAHQCKVSSCGESYREYMYYVLKGEQITETRKFCPVIYQ